MEEQQRNKLGFIINTVYVVLLLALGYVFMRYLFGLVSPFLLAFVIACLLEKPAKTLAERLKMPMKAVSLVLVVALYTVIGTAIFLVGAKLVSVIAGYVSQLPGLYTNQLVPFLMAMAESLEQVLARLDPALVEALDNAFHQFISSLGDLISDISRALVGYVSGFAVLVPTALLKALLMVISTFFFAGDCEGFSHATGKILTPKGREIMAQVRHYMRSTLLVVIRAYLLIMAITFLELAIGLSIIRIPNAVLIAFLIAAFDVLPVLGTGGIMIPWVVVTLFQGDYATGIGLLVLHTVITVVRNIIEPKFVGKQLGLHPAITLMSMFIGVSLFGLVGLFGLPIGLSLLKYLNSVGAINLTPTEDK